MKFVLMMTTVATSFLVPVTLDHLKDMLNQLRPSAKEACLPVLTITHSQPCETKRLSSQRQKRLYENQRVYVEAFSQIVGEPQKVL